MPDPFQPEPPVADHRHATEFVVEAGAVPGVVVLHVNGDLDAANASTLAAALDAAVTAGSSGVIIDAGGITFMDAAALRPIVDVANRSRHFPGIRVLDPSPPVRRILELTGMHGLVEDTVDLWAHPERLRN